MVESNGKAVLPQSLYEAQLALRLGKLPAWVSDVQQEQKQLESQPLVKFYDRNDPNSPTWFYPETFNVNDMLGYLTKLSLKMFNTKLYTYRITDDKATLHTDQSFVRQTLYALMNAIYQHHNTGNTITAQPMSINGKPGIEFVITSGQLSKPVTDLQADELVVAAHAMANRIGGKIQLKQSDSQIQFVVRIPQLSAQ